MRAASQRLTADAIEEARSWGGSLTLPEALEVARAARPEHGGEVVTSPNRTP